MPQQNKKKSVPQNPHDHIMIDAKGKSIGRLATEVVRIIRGKASPKFSYHIPPSARVTITNIGSVKISEKKLTTESYFSTSGYPGKKRFVGWDTLFKDNPQELFRRVISRMIPKTKFKDSIIRNISFK